MSLKMFINRAFESQVVVRALIMAAVVGSILVTINHGTCLIDGHFGFKCAWQSLLTYMVPYAVSTISSVLAMSEKEK